MAKGVTIKYTGLAELKKKLGTIPNTVTREVEAAMAAVAAKYVSRAVNEAPLDDGILKGAITQKKVAPMQYEVVSGAYHSVFIEFGTKKRYKAIPGVDASKYKGEKRGDYYDFLNNILDWVKRKGIGVTYNVAKKRKNRQKKDEYLAIAQAIANSIMRNGIHPHPFFFKQLPIAKQELDSKVNEIVKKAFK